jgi:hypothetical protein
MGLEDALARELRAWGASIVGFADLPSGARLGGFDKAISIAVRLSDWIIDSIAKGPTPLYYAHYNAEHPPGPIGPQGDRDPAGRRIWGPPHTRIDAGG